MNKPGEGLNGGFTVCFEKQKRICDLYLVEWFLFFQKRND